MKPLLKKGTFLMPQKSILFLLTLVVLLVNTFNVYAVTVSGTVNLENKSLISTYKVTLNGIDITAVKTNNFVIEVPANRIYQLMIEADGFYPSYQTFSHFELEELATNTAAQQLIIPEITLVERKEKRLMFAFAGDVMMGRRFSKPYFNEPVLITKDSALEDTKNIIQHAKPYMELADFAVVNLETTIAENKPEQRAPKSVTFFSPPETLEAIKWAGIDYVTLGNNHVYDYLDAGLNSTLKNLDESGLPYSGAGLDQVRALMPYYEQFSGQQYALLGFVGWQGNFTPHQAAGPTKGGAALGTRENIIQTVTDASNKGHPTIVQYHGSLEYSEEPSRMTESRLKTAIDQGADLVIAHHPHVTQGFEIYKDKLIAYSMGNFIFDQYFHATPLSYILYVWMDGEKFHRAEIVPLYLKGYVPIPATGIQRNALTKRTRTLSQRRSIHFTTSGGHLVIKNITAEPNITQQVISFKANETLKSIYQFPVSGIINKVNLSEKNTAYRLGENLLNGGDFETFTLFTSDERGWLLEAAKLSNTVAQSGKYSMAVDLIKNQTSIVGMQTFRRVFNYANPMTYQAKVLNKGRPIQAKLYMQFRGKNEKFFDALKEGKKTLLKELTIEPGMSWQNIQIDFNTPRVGYVSYRLLLELSTKKLDKSPDIVYLDNIALIQWQAHYNTENSLSADTSILGLATHIGLANATDHEQKITLQYND